MYTVRHTKTQSEGERHAQTQRAHTDTEMKEREHVHRLTDTTKCYLIVIVGHGGFGLL